MTSPYADRRARRDAFVSAGVLLLLAGLMLLTAAWYVKPRAYAPLPPARCRVTLVPPGRSKAEWAPIHFSLPSRVSFSRTVQPGDPRAVTKLGPRPEEVRYLPRTPSPAPAEAAPEKPAVPFFSPWQAGPPAFPPAAPAAAAGGVTAEVLDGAAVAWPGELAAGGAWAGSGGWSVQARLEAGADGRVGRVFFMPPGPPPAAADRLERVLRTARLEGGREARVRLGRTEPHAPANGEGARP